jgi:hypothetical protein
MEVETFRNTASKEGSPFKLSAVESTWPVIDMTMVVITKTGK